MLKENKKAPKVVEAVRSDSHNWYITLENIMPA